MDNEIWIDIKSFDGKYSVSNFGRVKSNYYIWKNQSGQSGKIHREKIFKLCKNSRGYFHVSLFDGVNRFRLRVHSLVAFHFVKNPENLLFVNHKDGIKTNNLYTNLEWVTHKQNMNHAWENGLMENARKVGEKHHRASLNADEVLEIRKMISDFKNNKIKYIVADRYKVSISTINDILKRRSWNHI